MCELREHPDFKAAIANGTSTTKLMLFNKQLTGFIPSEVSKLTKLEVLYLSRNNISDNIPSEISKLTNLESLDLSKNQLSGCIPNEITLLTNLRYLNNEFCGSLPDGFVQTFKFKNVDLSNNYFLEVEEPLPRGWKTLNAFQSKSKQKSARFV